MFRRPLIKYGAIYNSTYLLIRTFLLDHRVRNANAIDTNHAVLFLAKLFQINYVVRLMIIVMR